MASYLELRDLTHSDAHMDSCGGLNDLGFLFEGPDPIQTHLDIYCTKSTSSKVLKMTSWCSPEELSVSRHEPGFRWQ